MRITVWDMISVDEYFEGKSVTEYHIRYNSLRWLRIKLVFKFKLTLLKHVSLQPTKKQWTTSRYSKEVLKVQLSKLLMLVGRMGNQHIKSK
jgi:hypothetical protein